EQGSDDRRHEDQDPAVLDQVLSALLTPQALHRAARTGREFRRDKPRPKPSPHERFEHGWNLDHTSPPRQGPGAHPRRSKGPNLRLGPLAADPPTAAPCRATARWPGRGWWRRASNRCG